MEIKKCVCQFLVSFYRGVRLPSVSANNEENMVALDLENPVEQPTLTQNTSIIHSQDVIVLTFLFSIIPSSMVMVRPSEATPNRHAPIHANLPSAVTGRAMGSLKNLDWPILISAYCLTSATEISLQYMQADSQIGLNFHWVSLAISCAFTSLFIATFIGEDNFPATVRFLEVLGVWFGTLAFYLAITISSPTSIKQATWTLYAVAVVTIIACRIYSSYNNRSGTLSSPSPT